MHKLLLSTSVGVLALASVSVAKAEDALLTLQKDPKQWALPTGDYANLRYSTLKEINTTNVHKLVPAWSFSTGTLRGHEGAPLVLGDVMYLHTSFPNIVYALDLNDNGKIIWKYEPKQDPAVIGVMCCDTVNRGLAYGDGKIFLAQADTTLVALDAKTGKLVWSVKNGDPSKGQTSTAAPHVFKDKVLVGIAGGEFGVRGHITAYDVKDGHQLWRGYSMGPDSDTLIDPDKTTYLGKPVGPDSSTKTWEGDQWQIGGGTTWGWYSYDPELNLVYYGSGNPSTWNPKQRPGDNRWSMTLWARDLDTGKAKWVYQTTPHDEWDYDAINEIVLADQTIGGVKRKTAVHFDRNGFGYTLDRVTGELLVAEKFDPAVNWATKVDMDKSSPTYGRPLVVAKYSTEQNGEDVNTQGVCPAALGSKDEQPVSFNPETELFYVPTNHVCMDYEPFRVSYTAGQPYVGATLEMFPAGKVLGDGTTNTGNFIAWDARTGKIVWSDPEQFSVWSGTVSTAGGIAFYGTLEGYLKAVDLKTGKELYKFKTPSGIIGNVITYEHKGHQNVAVLSGVGGWAGIGLAAGLAKSNEGLGAVGNYKGLADYTALGGVLTVFALPSESASAAAPSSSAPAVWKSPAN
ncbi:lanthanide-dependent methanol dehydrogenase XoxF5 [Methylocystis bryophila]|uniref:PQQ-dependent dehydrogenase, methanol/ethanol family n=1 Tax=Methylocystis bryophila TaxID=655015 RepID=A0A1W6MSN3_9HYPH|nr:lanthanide-dependent methanol dehydrogenase XoxF5 [Methylocystis bryophila]ARN80623.1 PQQ-dependent dehydrogenase, methanol/ethanol family [Methylocystis bryophila]BDV40682.1 methanol dehydrogenase [Methylocystis bryophila]